ncbi:MAG: DUF4294 domain-containing protein [Flavobacteriales bacterium]|jgi:hypothetical protein|nr:DUF4294 domain-containing protein [Flavobacteriales bacterium]MCI1752704.1 DUF4294 domain-containing protein [Flavobacteriales bacterium]
MRTTVSILLLLACMAPASVWAQQTMVSVVIQGGDTMPTYTLAPVLVEAQMTRKVRRNAERIDRLTRYVQKVYPYALITAKLLDEYDHDLAAIHRESDKELYLKLAEAELRAEFDQDIKSMTVTQGRILVKLIDRQTGHTSYDLVKQLRGSFQAWMWQGVAKVFGNDLKGEYDPEGDDKLVESIVRRIENGELATTPREARTEKAVARLVKRKARLYRKYGVETPVVTSN